MSEAFLPASRDPLSVWMEEHETPAGGVKATNHQQMLL